MAAELPPPSGERLLSNDGGARSDGGSSGPPLSGAPSSPYCRVCFEGKDSGELITPCLCRGTMRYVHRGCLDRWRNATPFVPDYAARCEICQTRYILQARVPGPCGAARTCAAVVVCAALALAFGSAAAWAVQFGALAVPEIRRAYHLPSPESAGTVLREAVGWVGILGLVGCLTVLGVVLRELCKLRRAHPVCYGLLFLRIPLFLFFVIYAENVWSAVLVMACTVGVWCAMAGIGAITLIAMCVYGARVACRRAGEVLVQNYPAESESDQAFSV